VARHLWRWMVSGWYGVWLFGLGFVVADRTGPWNGEEVEFGSTHDELAVLGILGLEGADESHGCDVLAAGA